MSDAVTGPQPPLQAALDYENDDVVFKFLERFDVAEDEARELFTETRKWLWLCARARDREQRMAITHDLVVLDEMWHTFLLFTKEYERFCHDRTGRFIHHTPTSLAEKRRRAEQLAAEPALARERDDEFMRDELRFVAEYLGAETVFKWFVEYPRRYDRAFFERAHRPVQLGLRQAQLEQLAAIGDRWLPNICADAHSDGASTTRSPSKT